jgi:hypothetical protein
MQLQDLVIKDYTFTGLLYAFELPRQSFELLGASEDELLEIKGEFSVKFDGTFPIVDIEFCVAVVGRKSVNCSSYVIDYIKDIIQDVQIDSFNREEQMNQYYANTADEIFNIE